MSSQQDKPEFQKPVTDSVKEDENKNKIKNQKPVESRGSPISQSGTSSSSGATTTTTTKSTTTSTSSRSDSGSASTPSEFDTPRRNPTNQGRTQSVGSQYSSSSGSRTASGSRSRTAAVSGSGSSPGSRSGTSPSTNRVPANVGNIIRPGREFKSGIMNTPSTVTKVLSSSGGNRNYGYGNVVASSQTKPSVDSGLSLGKRPSDPQDPEKKLLISGNESYAKGDYKKALSDYDKAIAISPIEPAFRFNRSSALICLKRLAEAAEECDQVVKLEPGNANARHRLGSLLLRLGQVEIATRHFSCSPEPVPDLKELRKLETVENHLKKCGDARRVGDWGSVLKEMDAAIAAGANASPQFFACRAEALLKLYRLDDAISASIETDTRHLRTSLQTRIFGMLSEAYVYFVRSHIALAIGSFDEAAKWIEAAGKRDPENGEISRWHHTVKVVSGAHARGNDLFDSDRLTEACVAYAEGLRVDPTNSVLYCSRAACWYKLGEWGKSLDDSEQALRITPGYTKALLRRAAANFKLERWSEAVSDYEELRKQLPSDDAVAESLSCAQLALKKSRGENVSGLRYGRRVEPVSSLEHFQAAIAAPSWSVVHFRTRYNAASEEMSPFLDALCTKYPSVNFLKVDIDEGSAIAQAENVKIVPTFKIYRNSSRLKEMVCPSQETLESSVREYIVS